jgi:hypothetical protein
LEKLVTGKRSVRGVAWFRREDYPRIREISDDEMIASFEEWEARTTQFLASREEPGVILEKVIIDPEELLAFARQFHDGQINTKVRAEFAARLVMKKSEANH